LGDLGDSINKIINDHQEILITNSLYFVTINSVNVFGPITMSIKAISSNAGLTYETIKGFQIGEYSITESYLLAWI
jgi:hypothetical protein